MLSAGSIKRRPRKGWAVRGLLLAVGLVSGGLPIAFLLTKDLSVRPLASSDTSKNHGLESPPKRQYLKIMRRPAAAKTVKTSPKRATKMHVNKTKQRHGETSAKLAKKQEPSISLAKNKARKEKAFATFYGQDDDSGCHLIESSFQFLGCGFNGHVFSVLTECNTTQNEDKEKIVVKLTSKALANSTLRDDSNDTRPLGIYANETRRRHSSLLYERFFRSVGRQVRNSEEKKAFQKKILQHFILQIGVVHFPPPLLRYAALEFNRSATRGMRFRGIVPLQQDPQHPGDDSYIKGELYELLSDSTTILHWLGHKHNRMEEEGRQQHVVRQLVFMYRHMYERGILHCDMKLDHLMYSPSTNTTSIIDFDVYRLIPMPHQVEHDQATATTEIRRNDVLQHLLRQKKQQWQLLVLIANVCDSKAHQSQQKDLPLVWGSVICNKNIGTEIALMDPQQHFAAIFDKCNFDTSMAWSAGMINRTYDTYEALAEWSGL